MNLVPFCRQPQSRRHGFPQMGTGKTECPPVKQGAPAETHSRRHLCASAL